MATWRRRGPAEAGPCRFLVVDQDGPLVVEALRTPERGVKFGGILYPDELLRDLGAGVYMLATNLEIPADGDMSRNAPVEAVVTVGQLDYTASWESYDRARRRLNYDALWERGGNMGNLIKNFLFACIFMTSLLAGLAGLRAGGAASDLSREVSDLRAVIIKPTAALGAPGAPAVVPTLGPPAGDRPLPTATPRRP